MSNCLIVGTWGDSGSTLMLTMAIHKDTPEAELMSNAKTVLDTFLRDKCEFGDDDDMDLVAWINYVIRMPAGTDFEQMVVHTIEGD